MNRTESALTTVESMVSVSRPYPAGGVNPERAYALMKDVAAYPLYMPSVKAVEILEKSEDAMMTRWEAEIDGAPICWVQRLQTHDAVREILFEAIEGDFEIFQGRWSVNEREGKLFLNLRVAYRLGIPIIEKVLGPILEEKIKTNCQMMLTAIADQLTGTAS